jgi:hypothetical protein
VRRNGLIIKVGWQDEFMDLAHQRKKVKKGYKIRELFVLAPVDGVSYITYNNT